MKPLVIKHDVYVPHYGENTCIVEAHIDPKYNDIVMNGYGISKKQAKQLRDWVTKALKTIKDKK